MTEIYYGFSQYHQANTKLYLDKVTTASCQIFPCPALTQHHTESVNKI